jgi:hypothetical protein
MQQQSLAQEDVEQRPLASVLKCSKLERRPLHAQSGKNDVHASRPSLAYIVALVATSKLEENMRSKL